MPRYNPYYPYETKREYERERRSWDRFGRRFLAFNTATLILCAITLVGGVVFGGWR